MSRQIHIAVTGANGYIGRSVIAAGLKRQIRLTALTRTPFKSSSVAWARYDLADTNISVPEADAVLHLAYDTAGKLSIAEEEAALVRLMDAAAQRGARFIFVSSQSAKNPASEYGRRKQLLEARVLERGGTIVRPGLVYGGRTLAGLAARLSALAGLPVLPVPDRGVVVQPLHVQVLADALLAIAGRTGSGRIWELGGPPLPFSAFWRALAKARNKRPLVLPLPKSAFDFIGRFAGVNMRGSLHQMFEQQPLDDMSGQLGLHHIPLEHGCHAAVHPARRALLAEGKTLLNRLGLSRPGYRSLATYVRVLERSAVTPLPLWPDQLDHRAARWLAGRRREASGAETLAMRIRVAAGAYEMSASNARVLLKRPRRPFWLSVIHISRAVLREFFYRAVLLFRSGLR